MKKIVCDSCKNRRGDYGMWTIYNSVIICETCRLTAIEWMRLMGFGMGHPFIREISIVESRRKSKKSS